MAAIAQNVGILLQRRAEQIEDPGERDALLRRAVASIEESLGIKLDRNDPIAAAFSHSQLGVLHRMLGDLDLSEEQHRKALQIREPLNLPQVTNEYRGLAEIAEARGDAEAAAWAAKRDAKLKELKRLAGGDRASSTLPEQAAQAFLGLAQAVYATRVSGGELPADLAEVLAQLAGQPEPLARNRFTDLSPSFFSPVGPWVRSLGFQPQVSWPRFPASRRDAGWLPAPLWGADDWACVPGVKTPGYEPMSLRD